VIREEFIAVHSTVVQTTPTAALLAQLHTALGDMVDIIRRELIRRGVECPL